MVISIRSLHVQNIQSANLKLASKCIYVTMAGGWEL